MGRGSSWSPRTRRTVLLRRARRGKSWTRVTTATSRWRASQLSLARQVGERRRRSIMGKAIHPAATSKALNSADHLSSHVSTYSISPYILQAPCITFDISQLLGILYCSTPFVYITDLLFPFSLVFAKAVDLTTSLFSTEHKTDFD